MRPGTPSTIGLLLLGVTIACGGCVQPVIQALDPDWAKALPAAIVDVRFVATANKAPASPIPTFTYGNLPIPAYTYGNGTLGDPINLLIISNAEYIVASLKEAGWLVADPVTEATVLRMGTALDKGLPYVQAPVSDLFIRFGGDTTGRAQYVGFEKNSQDLAKRDHLRLYDLESPDYPQGVAVGSGVLAGFHVLVCQASRDDGVKVNPKTGLTTHRIDPDLDAERQLIVNDLTIHAPAHPFLLDSYLPTDPGAKNGKNAGDDPYFSDGQIAVLTEVATP